jgi:hypothetical protein
MGAVLPAARRGAGCTVSGGCVRRITQSRFSMISLARDHCSGGTTR